MGSDLVVRTLASHSRLDLACVAAAPSAGAAAGAANRSASGKAAGASAGVDVSAAGAWAPEVAGASAAVSRVVGLEVADPFSAPSAHLGALTGCVAATGSTPHWAPLLGRAPLDGGVLGGAGGNRESSRAIRCKASAETRRALGVVHMTRPRPVDSGLCAPIGEAGVSPLAAAGVVRVDAAPSEVLDGESG
eukprot:7391843-Prymnesium_polylepis.4